MSKEIMHFDGVFDSEKAQKFIQESSRENHFGSPEPISPGQLFRVKYEKSTSRPFPIYLHSTWDRYRLRRSAEDVRLSPIRAYAICVVEQGTVIVKQHGKTITVGSEGIFLVSMNDPYSVDHIPEKSHEFKVMYFFVPFSSLSVLDSFGGTAIFVRVTENHRRLIISAMRVLLESHSEFSSETLQGIYDGLVGLVSETLFAQRESPVVERRQRNSDIWNEVNSYIRGNFSNRELDLKSVARFVGVSDRTLSHLFHKRQTSFSSILWNTRVDVVRGWLASAQMRHAPIRQIAFAAGFKSAAHLSVRFKAVMGCSPSTFRDTCGLDPVTSEPVINVEHAPLAMKGLRL